jgi:hypothetical protein
MATLYLVHQTGGQAQPIIALTPPDNDELIRSVPKEVLD